MTAQFLTYLVTRELAQDRYRLVEPLVYESDLLDRIVTVPAGFETDFASVPRLPVVFWLTGATADRAAVVHDYLYATGIVSRKMADEVFAEACAATGVPAWRRGLMWLGVRVGGSSHYVRRSTGPQDGGKAPQT